MSKILIVRLSAIGDVAMTVPVIHSLAMQYPESEITVLSRPFLGALFQYMPGNVTFLGIDFSGEYKGFNGLIRLFNHLKTYKFDCVADFHDVLRTKVICTLFKLAGTPVARIEKGRSGKAKLTRRNRKVLEQQETSFQRYANVLEKLGYPIRLEFTSIYGDGKGDPSLIQPVAGEKGNGKWIGIAPFAKHAGKIYPIELQEQVIVVLSKMPGVKIFLFGGGKREKELMEVWAEKYPRVTSLAGKMNISLELNLMSHLDVMLSMDSGNMHLASLVGTPVVSVWGATHPYAGFMGWNQSAENAVQVDLNCRPCSVYGQKECYRKDYACLYRIAPDEIVRKVKALIENPRA